ncbi:unnamed protein product, partial [Strongylus vulgaris]
CNLVAYACWSRGRRVVLEAPLYPGRVEQEERERFCLFIKPTHSNPDPRVCVFERGSNPNLPLPKARSRFARPHGYHARTTGSKGMFVVHNFEYTSEQGEPAAQRVPPEEVPILPAGSGNVENQGIGGGCVSPSEVVETCPQSVTAESPSWTASVTENSPSCIVKAAAEPPSATEFLTANSPSWTTPVRVNMPEPTLPSPTNMTGTISSTVPSPPHLDSPKWKAFENSFRSFDVRAEVLHDATIDEGDNGADEVDELKRSLSENKGTADSESRGDKNDGNSVKSGEPENTNAQAASLHFHADGDDAEEPVLLGMNSTLEPTQSASSISSEDLMENPGKPNMYYRSDNDHDM